MGILKPLASDELAPDAVDAAQPDGQLPSLMVQHLAAERSAHGLPQRGGDGEAVAGAQQCRRRVWQTPWQDGATLCVQSGLQSAGR
jgi:hypothetical protein